MTWFNSWFINQIQYRAGISHQLTNVTEQEVRAGCEALSQQLKDVSSSDVRRAEEVGRYPQNFYHMSKEPKASTLEPDLDTEERKQLIAERERLFSQKGLVTIICTISLAAFLQGHVQSSINAGSLFARTDIKGTELNEWQLGGMNASPFLGAALLGAPLSLPVNYCVGRRGALGLSAILIVASSIGAAFSRTWIQVLGARIIGGLGMGIKAVSAPILASETAVGYWRGSTLLAWQLWVACGIMMGFVVNLVIARVTTALYMNREQILTKDAGYLTFQLILGAPLVPALFLLLAVCFCYESPRFYMRPGTPSFNIQRAFNVLLQVRPTRLQALRDLFLIWWPNRNSPDASLEREPGLTYAGRVNSVLKLSYTQYRTLFSERRLRNAVWSTCTVALAQQLCGINVFALYSNTYFSREGPEGNIDLKAPMIYSFGFGVVNTIFGLFAMRSLDTFGRRRWLLSTLPVMSLLLVAAAVSFGNETSQGARKTLGIVFIYIFAAVYSPGLGPIPFALASESFPLSHREAGASVAISINLFFAGMLTILLPSIDKKLKTAGTLGLFAGLNIVAFILIFFLVQETKELSLEDLDHLFDIPMQDFARERLEELGRRRRGPREAVIPPPGDAATPASRDAAIPPPRDSVNPPPKEAVIPPPTSAVTPPP